MRLNKTTLLFLVILIEGYVVLACELLAIRELIPFVGSGTEVISIIISAVLLPLAVGYHHGGEAFNRSYHRTKYHHKKLFSVRKLLLRNILSALIILTFGLSYPMLEIFFGLLNSLGIHHRLAQTAAYSTIFLVAPVFMLGQTIPLISNYFSRRKLSEITGKMLFFSTAGSFLGSVFSTIVLMSFIGVHNTVIITMGLLCVLCIVLVNKLFSYETVCSLFVFMVLCLLNSGGMLEALHIVSDNAYNTISIERASQKDATIFTVNRSPASVLGRNGETFSYVSYLESMVMRNSGLDHGKNPRDILVIGSGGFTFGLHDVYNHYTYVDIDPAIKDVAEEYFLHGRLTANKQFVPTSARAFVHDNQNRYDMILIDVYTNVYSTPMECTTREFLIDVKKLLKPDALLVLHTGTSPLFEDKFSVRYHDTFASVFPLYTRQVMGTYNPWPDAGQPAQLNIILYMYSNRDVSSWHGIYTDDKNTYSLDRD